MEDKWRKREREKGEIWSRKKGGRGGEIYNLFKDYNGAYRNIFDFCALKNQQVYFTPAVFLSSE